MFIIVICHVGKSNDMLGFQSSLSFSDEIAYTGPVQNGT